MISTWSNLTTMPGNVWKRLLISEKKSRLMSEKLSPETTWVCNFMIIDQLYGCFVLKALSTNIIPVILTEIDI
ncbi:hypothetical protein EUGRSUZ_F03484 [Eucalyptus grandis]|uniref:Uncharacterized protein n=2 Tax=Eucalyptus grandis TaxID=71139 RepID=A0ACC3KM48_EUCGR|nr:hypothetical protein EUGRSUZ_F03484 [Eucalyptus grandis]